MVQPPSYVVPRKKRLVYRLKKALYSLINGNDSTGIANFKTHLGKQYHNKDLGFLCYFIGIEVARSEEGIRLCQRKQLDLLSQTGTLGARLVDTPMDSSVKLDAVSGNVFQDIKRYWRLVDKLIYLTITHPDITYVVGVLSQFMHGVCQLHWEVVCCIL